MGVPRIVNGTYEELHLRYLLVDFLHELNDKVDKLMFQHLFSVKIGDQKRNIITLVMVSVNCFSSLQPIRYIGYVTLP